MSEKAPTHVYEIYIRTTPERLWAALTDGELTKKYFFGTVVHSNWRAGAPGAQIFGDVGVVSMRKLPRLEIANASS